MRTAVYNPQRANLERASEYMGYVRHLIGAGGDGMAAKSAFCAQYGNTSLGQALSKAAVTPGRTDGATWGEQLAELRPAADAFIELTRSRSIVGRMSGFRPASFRTKIPRQTAGSAVGWNAEGKPVQVSPLAFDQVQFEHSSVGGLVVFTKELATSSDPAAQRVIETDLTRSVGAFVDNAFLDPAAAAAGQAPASITYGVSPIEATGTTADALKADLKSLLADMIERGSDLEAIHFVMSKVQAAKIGMLGETWTDDLGPNGGTLLGLPVLTSSTATLTDADSPGEEMIFAIDAARVLLADDGVEISASQQGTVQMETTPDSPATASTILVPLWQQNLVGVKIVRHIRWEPANDGASGWIAGANYGG